MTRPEDSGILPHVTDSNEAQPRTISRRALTRTAGIGAGAFAASAVLGHGMAQDATPGATPGASPAAAPSGDTPPDPNATFKVISPSREDVTARLLEAHAFEDPRHTGGELVQAFTTDISTLNPLLLQDAASATITGLIYEPLLDINPIDGTYRPLLADSWELGSDGVRYRFHLNPNATWHDGEPVTADDVIFSFDAVLDENGFSPVQGTVSRALASYEKVDDLTVELVSRAPSATFLTETAANVAIMPKHIWASIAIEDWITAPGTTGEDPSQVIGSGPFTFVEWVQGSNVTVARNDDYWLSDQVPVIDRYIYRVVGEASSALRSLQTGESDISGIPASLAPPFIEDNPDLTVHQYDLSQITYVLTNMDAERTELFQDVRVRQAMMYAIDRDLIAETIFQGFAIRADGPHPPLSLAYAPDRIESIYLYEPETASALLDDAGWVIGEDGIREKDGERFSFEFTYEEGIDTFQQLVPYLQQAWREVGIEMTPTAMPYPAQQEELNKRNYEAALTGISLNTTGNQGVLFRCDSWYPDGYNEVAYCNPEYDRLDDLQRQELDPERRMDLMVEAANIIAHDVPIEPLVFPRGLVASAPRVHNFFPSGYSTLWTIQWIWLDPM